MADSSTSMAGTNNSTRKSSRIAKRLTPTAPITGTTTTESSDIGSSGIDTKKKQKTTTSSSSSTSTSTNTKGNATKHPIALTPASLRSTGIYENISSPLECDVILNEILSYVGDYQYLFIGSVNSTFEKSYATVFPKKTTHFNASTIKHTKFCWDIICKINDDETKDKEKRKLWHSAARYGKIEVVNYMLESPPSSMEIDWIYDIGSTAAKYGQMELLQWACDENICVSKDDDMICHSAIAHGHIDIFQWAIKNGFAFNDHDMAGYEACKNGQLEALKFLIDNEYDVNVGGGSYGENCGCCNSAAEKGQLHILIWLHENYDPICDGYTMDNAVSSGHIPTIKYLLDKECRWHSLHETYNLAAFVGSLAMIQSLRALDIEWDEDAIVEKAAEGGHLDIIEWAHENGCSLTESACQYAAGFGHLDSLKGLRALDCPWDEKTTKYASTDEIYDWAKMNGCPVAKGNPREKLQHSCEYLTEDS